jgi:hypothetical protein
LRLPASVSCRAFGVGGSSACRNHVHNYDPLTWAGVILDLVVRTHDGEAATVLRRHFRYLIGRNGLERERRARVCWHLRPLCSTLSTSPESWSRSSNTAGGAASRCLVNVSRNRWQRGPRSTLTYPPDTCRIAEHYSVTMLPQAQMYCSAHDMLAG